MKPQCSAYLTIYDDWDFLRASLESVRPFIDELVVVDGAYRWMTGYLRAIGKDPMRSNHRVYQAFANLDLPMRVIEGIWEDEFQKRAAGFAACAHRYVFRVDADEIVFHNPTAIQSFVDTNQAVAEMEIPAICHTPDWVEADSLNGPIPRVGFLFDRKQIEPMDHLRYLWIVAEDKPAPMRELPPPWTEPIARAVHLTAWRSPEGALNRSAFYNLSYIRNHGCNWLPELQDRPVRDLGKMFTYAAPNAYSCSLMFSAQCCSDFDFTNKVLAPSPFTPIQKAIVEPHYEFFLRSHEARNLQLSRKKQWFVQGQFTRIDVTTNRAAEAIIDEGTVELIFSHAPTSAQVEMHVLCPTAPFSKRMPLPYDIRGNALCIEVPAAVREAPALRRLIRFAVWTREPDSLQQFQAAALIAYLD